MMSKKIRKINEEPMIMKNEKPTAILASFATLKGLNDAKKFVNSYQLLSEFINYIIVTCNLFEFTAIEMKNRLSETFGFDIPEAVVKTASQSLAFVTKTSGMYKVDFSRLVRDETLAKTITIAEDMNNKIIDGLTKYVIEKHSEKSIDTRTLIQDFITFVIDDQQKSSGKYTNYISEYVLKNESNKEIQECLSNIREGSILYIGLNYNIHDTGSIKNKLTLYLDTEVLFSLMGYNGEIYQQLADDFYSQVRHANSNKKIILLRYFREVKKEIDDFFFNARLIVDGKPMALDKPAMKNIVNGCKSSVDVEIKQADFYQKLNQLGIIEDDRDDYYDPKNNLYNLENMQQVELQTQEEWKFISHINKLRKGKVTGDITQSEYLLITNTGAILRASRECVDKMKITKNMSYVSDYAVSVNRITDILWYKLGKGFGVNAYPTNVNAVLKARIVLSSDISHNILKVYNESAEQYQNGEISKDQFTYRIIALRNKPILPEELYGDDLENLMDFSEEFLSRYAEKIETDKKTIQEQEKEITKFEAEIEKKDSELRKKDKEIEEKDLIIQSQRDETDELKQELSDYRKKEEAIRKRKKRFKRIFFFSINILWKVALVGAIIVAAILCNKYLDNNILTIIFGIVDIITLPVLAWTVIKKDIAKYFPRENKKK